MFTNNFCCLSEKVLIIIFFFLSFSIIILHMSVCMINYHILIRLMNDGDVKFIWIKLIDKYMRLVWQQQQQREH
jgi:hypothetical protein